MASPRGGRGGAGGRGGRGGTGGKPGALGEAGKPGEPGLRGEKGDKGDRGKSGARYFATLAPYLAILALFLYDYAGDEGRDDQLCTLIEGSHLDEIRQLEGTYNYLKTESPAELKSGLNVAILRGLPAQEERASTDTAPPFCDDRSIFHGEYGNAEPDPEVPKRPRALKGL